MLLTISDVVLVQKFGKKMIQRIIIFLTLPRPHSARMIDVSGLVQNGVGSWIRKFEMFAWFASERQPRGDQLAKRIAADSLNHFVGALQPLVDRFAPVGCRGVV